MDAAADATPLGAWASIRGYFTPATLFLVVNLVIGTIALTSRVSSHQRRRRDYHLHYDDGRHPHPHHQEPLHPHQHQQQEYHHYYHPEQQPQYVTPPPPPPAPAPLARTSSVLDRLRSLGLYRFRSGDFPPEYGAATAAGANHTHDVFYPVVVEEEGTAKQAHYPRSRSEPEPAREEEKRPAPRMKKSGSEARKAQVARAPALVVDAVAENEAADARAEDFVGSFRREPPPQQAAEYHYQEEYVPPAVPAPLARVPSILERLRSVDLYGFLAPALPAAAPAPARGSLAAPADEKKKQAAHYNRSRSEPTREEGKTEKKQQAAEARMAKSSSVARKPAGPRLVEADDCVDARAEAFIDSFRREYVTPPAAPPQQKQQQAHHDQDEHVVPPPPPLARTASVLDRLRSFGLYRFRSGDLGPDHPAAESTPAAADGKAHQQAHYGRSRSEPPQGKKEKKPQGAEARRMSKSSSESIVEEAEPEACVDARADDFINKFRKQLQLQRLNSLLNYKEMLTGGGKQQ